MRQIDQEVEGRIKELNKEGIWPSLIQRMLKKKNIIVSRKTIDNVLKNIGKARQAKLKGQVFKRERVRPVRIEKKHKSS